MAATVKVDEGYKIDFSCGIGGSGGELLGCGIVGVNIGLVMLRVVEFHYFARDGGLESAVIIWDWFYISH